MRKRVKMGMISCALGLIGIATLLAQPAPSAEPVFSADGGPPMVLHRFDGQLMMVLHQPNKVPDERVRIFEMDDTGDSIRLKK